MVLGPEGTLQHPEPHPWDVQLHSSTAAASQPQTPDSASPFILRRDPLRDAD